MEYSKLFSHDALVNICLIIEHTKLAGKRDNDPKYAKVDGNQGFRK